ncbi:MAG: hypothetical protein QOJ43_2754, partial [Gaiellaceae bacterium]|nr:hypothetical protein [Gaiellaceae bacterium]
MTPARLSRPDLPLYLAGGALTVATSFVATESNGPLVLVALAGLAFFLATATCFAVAPHVAIALTIPLFAILPTLKALGSPSIGPLKDLVTLAAGVATAVIAAQALERRTEWIDPRVALAVVALLGLYVVNLGGLLGGTAFEAGWFHGVRLVA